MTNYSFVDKYIEAYLCSSYYFDDYINGEMFNYLFKNECSPYKFKLKSYEIKPFKEYTNVPEEFIKKFGGSHNERQVIHLICSFTSNATIEISISKYNLYISKKKFFKFVRNKIKKNHESKH